MEAVGILLQNDQIILLENSSSNPQGEFLVDKQAIIDALTGVEDITDITLWHSHPEGGIGPSRIDMQQKTAFPNHLVITLVVDELVYTWY